MSVEALDSLPRAFARSFVPPQLVVRDFADVKPLFEKLLAAELDTKPALEKWLLDWSELAGIVDEAGARIYIRSTVDTTSEQYRKDFMHWVEHMDPQLKPVTQQLQRKLAASPARKLLDANYAVLERSVLNQLALYREENIPLQTELSKLTNRYDEIQGAVTVNFDGQERTPQQMGKLLLEPDRALRERAWRTLATRRLQDAGALDELFEAQLRLREQVARNAGCADYRAYTFRAYERFDYTPAHCDAYADAVEKVVLPVLARMHDKRRADMKLDRLRPWDLAADPKGLAPLKPFENAQRLEEGCSRIFERVDPWLGGCFGRMRTLGLLDLANRKGKAPGGYQSTLNEVRLPFIFMNAVGVDGDVRTLLHEGGHAFHAFESAGQPLLPYRSAPMEFCEVASMAMELLGFSCLDEFYKGTDLVRARVEFFKDLLTFLPWYATIDQFQHWVYTHPGHTRAERDRAWLAVFRRFNPAADWSGLEDVQRVRWHQQGHLFFAPFYYIEYAIAQVGALQVWMNARRDRPEAIRRYRYALSLGGSRPLPELFAAAGLKFAFDAETLKPLVDAVQHELEQAQQA